MRLLRRNRRTRAVPRHAVRHVQIRPAAGKERGRKLPRSAYIAPPRQPGRERLIEDYAIILGVLTDTEALDKAQQTECDVTIELLRKCVEENTRVAANQAVYRRRYDALAARYEAAKKRLGEVAEEKQTRAAKRESVSRFMEELKRCGGLLAEFDEGLWRQTVEAVTVHLEKDVAVTFRDGSEVRMDARLK